MSVVLALPLVLAYPSDPVVCDGSTNSLTKNSSDEASVPAAVSGARQRRKNAPTGVIAG